jgi:preprotein translocase SecE subunit
MATTTTPARSGDTPAASGGGLMEYLRGVREELKKAQWPTRAELIQLTKVVLVIIVVVAAYCGALDALLGLVTNALFNRK